MQGELAGTLRVDKESKRLNTDFFLKDAQMSVVVFSDQCA